MTHLALYREWRPRTFDEIVEQKHAVFALRQTVISGQIGHAYLFSGTRGTGKTTLAKVFSRAINCLQPDQGNPCNSCEICRGILSGSLLDVLEIDAASNNSVDNIRRICDEVVFMPSQAKYKVYIIDEVHMLSTGAFNALLKTLEEPPAHAVFILATTEPHRIPATILSRCQRYDFRRLPVASMIERLEKIAASDGIEIESDAVQTIAMLADGALRDAISLLDQAKTSFDHKISRDDVLALAGVVHDEFMMLMSDAMLNGDTANLLQLIDQLVMDGRDLPRFVTDLAQHFRNMLICNVSENPESLLRISRESLTVLMQAAQNADSQKLIELIQGLSALLSDLRWAADARTALEIGLIRLVGINAQVVKPAAVKAASKTRPAPPPTETEAEADPIRAEPKAEPEPDSIAAEPELEPEPDNIAAEPEPDNMTAEETGMTAESLWSGALSQLQESGQMTLYLFSRPARPQLTGKTLQLHFSSADKLNFSEISEESNLRLLKESVKAACGQSLSVKPLLDAAEVQALPKEKETDWIDKVRAAADDLGIPVQQDE